MQYFYLFMTALFTALIMVPMLRRWALETGNLDQPDARKVHTGSVPRLGGIAIFIAFFFAILVYGEVTREVRGILAGGLIIFTTGLIDDLVGLSPKRKFLGEIAACLVTISVGRLYIWNLGDPLGLGQVVLPVWVAVPFTLFAAVGVINAINLIDGLDGLAGGVSTIALSAFFLLGLYDGNSQILLITAALLGGLLGFLKYNLFPARIFMGDVGSLALGFLLAFCAVLLTQRPGGTVSPVLPVLILGLPIVDTIWVMTRRMTKGQSPFSPDMTHVHHKFLNLGFQHRFTVLIIYGISLFWTIFAITFRNAPDYLLLGIYAGVSLLSYVGISYMMRNRDRFPILSHDSGRSLRASDTYQQLVEKMDWLTLPLAACFYLCLALAVSVQFTTGPLVYQITGVLFLAFMGIVVLTRDLFNHFVLAFAYLACLLVVFFLDQPEAVLFHREFRFQALTDLLFLVMAFLVVLKIVFKRQTEFFLTAPIDFLILTMSVGLAVVTPDLPLTQNLDTMIAKGIVLFLTIKILSSSSSPKQAASLMTAILAALLTLVLKTNLPALL